MSVEIREIVLRTEINSQTTRQPSALNEEQLKQIKRAVLAELLRMSKRSSRTKSNR